MKVSINTIKDWFRRGLRPTESQFFQTWDSFWHKDEQIPAASIEDLQENLDGKLDVELYENNNSQSTSFKNVGDGTPNIDTEVDAYREGKIGIGEPNPIETVDVIGSGKFQYTYEDGAISRATLGGENTNSEIGLPSGFIKTNTLNFFPDPTVHPLTQGYFYTGDISSLSPVTGKLSTGIGIANFTNTQYARTTYFPSSGNGNPESEFVGFFEARHEDGNAASVRIYNKGRDVGKQKESFLILRSSNSDTISRITLSPRIAAIEGALLQLKEYAGDTIVRNYTHNDDITNTGTATTTIGNLNVLGIDNEGNVAKITSYKESGSDQDELLVEIGDLSDISNGTKITIDNDDEIITLKTSNIIALNSRHILAVDFPIENINNPKSLTTKEYVDSKFSVLSREYYAELTFDGAGKITVNEMKNTFEDASNNVNIGTSSYFTQGTGKDASYILNFINESGSGGTSEVITKGTDSRVTNRIIKFFQYSEGAVFDDGLSDTLVTVYSAENETFVRIRVLDIKTGNILSTTSQLNGKLIMHVKEI